MLDRVFVIFNPAARSERASRQRERFAALSPRADVCPTEDQGHAAELARQAVAAGYRTVVAAGGDGTVNEVVNGIAGADVALGLLPLGTMNVFAAELGIPGNRLRRGWEIIEQGHTRRVDLACANDHHFVQLAGIGFDAQAVAEVDREMKRNFGPLSYAIAAAKIAGRRPPRLWIEADDGETPGAGEGNGEPATRCEEGSFVLVGNGRFYGGPVRLFKHARLDDGRLDVIVCKNLSHLDLLRYLQCVFFGTHLDQPDVSYFQARRVRVSVLDGEGEAAVPFEADGELAGQAPVTFRVLPGALRVLAPPAQNLSRTVALPARHLLSALGMAPPAR